MKLRNKKTGEMATLTLSSNGEELLIMKNNEMVTRDVKLSDLEEWEDVTEEPKEYWYIDCDGEVYSADRLIGFDLDRMLNIVNRFNSREEAEKAVEKLRAYKRLKDKGFRFTGVEDAERTIRFEIPFRAGYDSCEAGADLDICFGGERMTEKDDWEKMQAGEWHCACCDTYLEPIDSDHVICPKCGLRHRFKNGVIQTKGNMMEDYDE